MMGIAQEITIQVKLFGGFRKFGESLALHVPSGSSVVAVKDALAQVLDGQDQALIAASVLANDNSILRDDDIFEQDIELSILPPVCGG